MRLRVACCQLDPVVGDVVGNAEAIVAALAEVEAAGAELAVFGELAITGYPPEDLVLKPGFVGDNRRALDRVAAASGGCVAIVGFVDVDPDGRLYDAAAVCAQGAVHGVYRKRILANYAVFDEHRWFEPGLGEPSLFVVGGVRVGVSICEDVWFPDGPVAVEAAGGAELVVTLNASPYYVGRLAQRRAMLGERAAGAGVPLVYVNQVGGQDELVFDGASLVLDAAGEVIGRAAQFEPELLVVDVEVPARPAPPTLPVVSVTGESAGPTFSARSGRHVGLSAPRTGGRGPIDGEPAPQLAPRLAAVLDPVAEVYQALVAGTRGYVTKNGFRDVVIGLSGGIDSSLVAAVAVDALGPEHVHGVSMPSRYSSDGSRHDARALAERLGIDLRTIPIEPAFSALLGMLGPSLGERPPGLTEENLQSRIRGVTLMALSNELGWMVLTTGNKSELAVGYFTLYGDSAGGFAVIKDVPKLLVYRLCRWRNQRDGVEVIPAEVLAKPPSAELRPDQTDDQSLPPYDVLDPLLEAYVEGDQTRAELVAAGFPAELVDRITRLVDLAEYKRRQTPPGVRVTPKAFGRDRRLPVTNGYRG